ncbi:hypothetical protein D3C76_1368190 [compost metagenome]
MGQAQGGADAEHGDGQFQAHIQQHRAPQTVGPAPERQAAQGEAGEEGTDARGHGVHFDADHKRQLFDPEDLIDQAGGAGEEEQRCRQRYRQARLGLRRVGDHGGCCW